MFNAIQCFAKYNNRDIYAGLEGQHMDIFVIVNDDHLWWAGSLVVYLARDKLVPV